MYPQNKLPWMKQVVSVHSSIHRSFPPSWRRLKMNIPALSSIIHLPPRTLPCCCPALPRPPIPCPVQTSGTRLPATFTAGYSQVSWMNPNKYSSTAFVCQETPRHSLGPADERRAAIHPWHAAPHRTHSRIPWMNVDTSFIYGMLLQCCQHAEIR